MTIIRYDAADQPEHILEKVHDLGCEYLDNCKKLNYYPAFKHAYKITITVEEVE